MLNMSTPVIIPYLVKLINKSLNEGNFPPFWSFLIKPLHKTHAPLSPSETRPIALLPEVSKILERNAFLQLSAFVVEFNLLSLFQSYYKKGQGTHTALLWVLEETRRGIEDEKMTKIVLFDLTKALDCIPHKLLPNKLRKMDIEEGSIRWISSYLMSRRQSVRDKKGRSTGYRPVASGVP